jgi:hypothetical protein
MRFLAGALLAAWAFTSHANTFSTDYSDLWWNSDESGWGANVVQQNDTMFITLFVYDAQGKPTWLVAPSMTQLVAGSFKGHIYVTTGPWYATTFDTTLVTTSQVGDATFTPSGWNSATLTYNVGGYVIMKKLSRQSWKSDDLSGTYHGGREGTWAGCGSPLNGRVSSASYIGITQSGTDVSISDSGQGYSCQYSGKIQQAGRMMEIVGTGVCDDHVSRFLDATEVMATREGFSMRYRMQQTGTDCIFTGYAGGVRIAP